MPLAITKVSDDRFLAVWTDIGGRVLKNIDTPICEKELIDVLSTAGCHRIDIYDALEEVSPKISTDMVEDTKSAVADLARRGLYKPGGNR